LREIVMSIQNLQQLLPQQAPDAHIPRMIRFAMRRMAIGGLSDAHATNAMLACFGMSYRRPLMFLRVLMEEVARIAQQPITVAPCCCPRVTDGEAALLVLIECSSSDPDAARAVLARVTGSLDTLAALSIAQALGDALADTGKPFSL
jgi:hypothetical protein